MNNCLPEGYILSFPNQEEKYTIEKVVGRGATAITYRAEKGSGSECILKEYCPYSLFLTRTSNGALLCDEKHQNKFEQRKKDFKHSGDRQKEIREKIRNETPPFHGIYEANNTLYFEVTSYDGKTLDHYINKPLLTKIKLCHTVSKLIKQYHDNRYLCLDIKPDNIFVLTNSSNEIVTKLVEYIDFDSVRTKKELAIGQSISYTRSWAAPEQTNPYSYSRISEATDIYALGELIFWAVFKRHSTDYEQRDFSVYPFDEVQDTESKMILSRTSVQNVLSEIFHRTIRSAPENRFQSIDELLPLLNRLKEEIGKKEYVIEPTIRPNDFFIGRTDELKQIDDALHQHDIVFVSGIAGIGKSELVKQYICAHKKEYNNILYWTYEGNLDNMIARESTVRVAGLPRILEETDSEYARKMLKKIAYLTNGDRNLIIIDNLDQLVDELPQKDTWSQITNLQGKILITTRTAETLYKSVVIDMLPSNNDRIRLFREFCPFNDEYLEDVKQIIDSVNGHTLLINLLACYTREAHFTPKQAYEKMLHNGIFGLTNESVRILKDGVPTSDSVHECIQKLFDMESMTDGSKLVLSMLAFLPVEGVSANKFKAFYSIEDCENLNWLIRHGWVTSILGNCEVLRIHPTVQTVAIEYLKTNEELRDKFFEICLKAIKVRKVKEISEAEQVRFADSLAAVTKSSNLNYRSPADFICKYVRGFSRYGNLSLKESQISFAIDALKTNGDDSKYSSTLERCYFEKAQLLFSQLKIQEVQRLSEEHLQKAKAEKDNNFSARWHFLLWKCNEYSQDQYSDEYIKSYFYHFFAGFHFAKKDYSDDLGLLIATYAESHANDVMFFTKGSKLEKFNVNNAIQQREDINKKDKFLRNTSNSFEIVIDKAIIEFLSGNYHAAKRTLLSLVDFCNKRELISTSPLYRAHQMLAHIALRDEPQDLSSAITEFTCCLDISKDLSYQNTYDVRCELGYVYTQVGNPQAAEEVNRPLLQEVKTIGTEVRRTYYADVLRNYGYLYSCRGDHTRAKKYLKRAINEYNVAIASDKCKEFGRARTYMHLAKCYNMSDTDADYSAAIARLCKAKDQFEKSVGLNHPEAKACLEQLKRLQSESS